MQQFLIATIFAVLSTSQSGPTDGATQNAIAQSLVDAVVADDLVSYSQCWISSAQMISAIQSFDDKFTDTDGQGLREYHALRNKDIAESFHKIQNLIRDKNIDRTQIHLTKCEAIRVQEKSSPTGKYINAGSFDIVISAGSQVWKFGIDDGVFMNGLWYFVDSPINLASGSETLSFRDHRK